LGDTITCLVRGPASRHPRGFLWLFPVWFLILTAVVLGVGVSASGHLPLWLGVTEIGALAIAFCTAFCVQATARHAAFRADSEGVRIGVKFRTTRYRPGLRQVRLTWDQVAQLRMVPRRYGVLLEIVLSPAASIVRPPSLVRQGLVLAGTLVMPVGLGLRKPALTTPELEPPRYRLPISDRTVPELRAELAALKPASVSVRFVTTKAALRFAIPPPRKPVSRRPPTPVG